MFPLPLNYAQEMVAHALALAPVECCGLLAGKEGRAKHLYRAQNIENSPVRYSLEPKELYLLLQDMEKRGWELLGIYHSHTHSEAYPSATDIKLAFWPDCLYFIVSLKNPQEPVIRAFHISDGQVKEEELEVLEET